MAQVGDGDDVHASRFFRDNDLRIWRRLVTIFDALFGCWHKRMSFPLTSKRGQRRSDAATQTGTYIVCLDCGKEFPYDWKNMRVLSAGEKPAYAGAAVELEAKAS
jgi:hypothetical protein